jgi:hypothetical protein
MADFAVWLKNQSAAQDANLQALQDFAASQASIWPYGSNDIGDYVPVVTGNATDAARNGLLTALARHYADWKLAGSPRLRVAPGFGISDFGMLAVSACSL